MSLHSLPVDRLVSPAQVWARLTADLQGRAIHLMAQLAWHAVAAQAAVPLQEAPDDLPSPQPQDPARAS
jgi:hypothetical protein